MTSTTEELGRQFEPTRNVTAGAPPNARVRRRAGKLAAAGVVGLIVLAWSVVLPIVGLLYLFRALH